MMVCVKTRKWRLSFAGTIRHHETHLITHVAHQSAVAFSFFLGCTGGFLGRCSDSNRNIPHMIYLRAVGDV